MAGSVYAVGTAGTGSGDVVPGLPAGTVTDDVLVLIAETSAAEAIPRINGWTEVAGSPVIAADTRLTVRWRRAGAAEVAPTVPDPGNHVVARIVGLRGIADRDAPYDPLATAVSVEATVDTSAAFPAVTTNFVECLILNAIAIGTDTTSAQFSAFTNAGLVGVTEQVDSGTTFNDGGVIGAATGVKVAAGSTGSTTATLATAAAKAMMTIAFLPVEHKPLRAPLDVRIDIAPGADPDGDPALWQWLDVGGYRRQSADIEMHYGRDDESSTVEPGDASWMFDLRDGLLSPRNPLSALYRKIGVNTPVRVRLPIFADDFDRTVTTSWGSPVAGQTWTQRVGATSWTVDGSVGKMALTTVNTAEFITLSGMAALDIDLVYSAAMNVVTTGAPWISSVVFHYVDTSNYYRVHTEFKPSGVITIKIVKVLAGVETALAEDLTPAPTYTAGSKVWTRAQMIGGAIRARCWSGTLANEPTTWDVIGQDGAIDSGTFGFYQWRFVGNTNAGTINVAIDDVRVQAILWNGNIPEWPPRWDLSGNDSTMSITATGPMGRWQIGDDPVFSPITRQLRQYGGDLWPFEDASTATAAANLTPGHAPAVCFDIGFASDSSLPGSTSVATFNSDKSYFYGQALSPTGPGFCALLYFKLPALPASETVLFSVYEGTHRWAVSVDGSGIITDAFSIAGNTTTQILSGTTISYIIDPTEWFAIRLQVSQVSGNMFWETAWYAIGDTNAWGTSGNVSGTVGSSSYVSTIPDPNFVGLLFGEVWLGGANILPFGNDAFKLVSNGYVNETAAARELRLATEAGRLMSVTSRGSEPQGKQPVGKVLDLLRTTAASDPGVLFESGEGLGYIDRAARYNKAVALTLDWTGGDLGAGPEPTDDNQRLRNRWTVSRTGGSQATEQDSTSVARHGVIGDTAEVNISLDARLPDFASWFLSISSLDEMRWPVIVIDLLAHPELIPQALSTRVGSRITVINPKAQVLGISIDVIVEGVKPTIGRHKWTIEFACSPASPYDIARYDDLSKRVDSLTSTLNAAYSSTAATMVVKFTDPADAWSTVNEPYLWDVAGEMIRVDTMGSVTGSGPYTQSAGVTRSLNGVAKAQVSGEVVHIHPTQLARYAL